MLTVPADDLISDLGSGSAGPGARGEIRPPGAASGEPAGDDPTQCERGPPSASATRSQLALLLLHDAQLELRAERADEPLHGPRRRITCAERTSSHGEAVGAGALAAG